MSTICPGNKKATENQWLSFNFVGVAGLEPIIYVHTKLIIITLYTYIYIYED
jgi:hypothetical protein